MSDRNPDRDDLAGDEDAPTIPSATPPDGEDALPPGDTVSERPPAPAEDTTTTGEDTTNEDPPDNGDSGPDAAAEDAAAEDSLDRDTASQDTPGEDNPDRDTPGNSDSRHDTAAEDDSDRDAAGQDTPGEDNPDRDGAGEDSADRDRSGGDRAGEGIAREDGLSGPVLNGGPVEEGGSRRRKVLRRTAFGLVVVLLLGGVGAAWLYRDLVGGIEQKDVGDRLGANRPEKLNKALNILLIGSDTREGDNAQYAVPSMSGARSDTAILLHLSPNRDQAVGISFPRDSMVKIPECEKDDGGTVPARFGMLNTAFAFAGPTCTWKMLESLTGVHIDHFVQVDFSGFKRMVDALGGVEICVAKPVHDPRAELYLKAGKQTVKGEQALGYVRARYSLGNGSDLDRIERQQEFMAAVAQKATDSVLGDPAKTYKFLKAATKSMTTDDELDLSAMRKLADGLRGMSAGQVRFVTVPVERYAPDPNRVQWNQVEAKALFEAVRHDNDLPAKPAEPGRPRQAPPSPGEVNVAVVDAGAKDALVKRVVRQLGKRGYKVAEKVEKAATVPDSHIEYASSAEAQASALARDVPNALLTADAKTPKDGVRLVIGEKGVRLTPRPIDRIGGGVKADDDPCK